MTNWTKTGDWHPAVSTGPTYLHASRRVFVSGGYGATGDNLRGWRKGKHYTVFLRIVGKQWPVDIGSFCSIAAAKKAAEKAVQS